MYCMKQMRMGVHTDVHNAPPTTRENGTIITATRVASLSLVATNDSREVSADWLGA